MIKYIFTMILSLCLTQILFAQQVAKYGYHDVLLRNATVHTITDGTLANTDVLIQKGKIANVGKALTVNDNTKVIDCSGQHIYPGFIDGGTKLGLSEVGAVSLTNDHNEIGSIIPQMQALTAVNPNSVSIPVTRVNGVTSVIVTPTGGTFPGTAALIDLVGYTPEQMYAGYKAVVMNFPSTGKRGWWDRRSDEDIKKAYDKALKSLNETWDQVALYHKIDSAKTSGYKMTYQPEMEALLPVYRGEMPLMINANKKTDILGAIKWAKDKGIKAILTGVSEGYRTLDEIVESGYPVVTGPVIAIPGRGAAKYDIAYRNAAEMTNAGIKVALRTNDTENVRNLPFNAGFAATYGMTIDQALAAITIIPAEIFGVADKYGSITKGKMASLFVADGDPFEMKTRIKHLYINGWDVPLESRHTLLYDEFLERNPGVDD